MGLNIHRLARSAEVLASASDPREWLTPVERQRADELIREQDREDFIAAHILVRQVAGELVGAKGRDLRLVQICETCAGPHGLPRIEGRDDVHVSLAHSRGWVAAIAADRRCGIDVENVVELRRVGVVRAALTHMESAWIDESADQIDAFAQVWVRKESLVKVGVVRIEDLANVDLVDRGRLVEAWKGRRFGVVEAPPGVAAAFAR